MKERQRDCHFTLLHLETSASSLKAHCHCSPPLFPSLSPSLSPSPSRLDLKGAGEGGSEQAHPSSWWWTTWEYWDSSSFQTWTWCVPKAADRRKRRGVGLHPCEQMRERKSLQPRSQSLQEWSSHQFGWLEMRPSDGMTLRWEREWGSAGMESGAWLCEERVCAVTIWWRKCQCCEWSAGGRGSSPWSSCSADASASCVCYATPYRLSQWRFWWEEQEQERQSHWRGLRFPDGRMNGHRLPSWRHSAASAPQWMSGEIWAPAANTLPRVFCICDRSDQEWEVAEEGEVSHKRSE